MTTRPARLRDQVIGHRGPNQQALQVQGDLIITNTAGTELFNLDVSGPTLTLNAALTALTDLDDSAALVFGTGNDISMTWDNTSFKITQAAENSAMQFGVDGAGIDILWFGDTAGASFTWDQSADSAIFGDNAKLVFGAGSDVSIAWDNTDLDILAAANNSVIKIGNGTNDFDVWLFGSTAAHYLSWDASANDLKAEDAVSLMFGTGAGAGPGTAGDVEVRWDATDLDWLAAADDTVMKFGNGTNSFDLWVYGNAATEYVLWDASADTLSFQGTAKLGRTLITTVPGMNGAVSLTSATSGQYHISTAAVAYTLPAIATSAGVIFHFVHGAAGDFTIAAPAGKLVGFNNATGTNFLCTGAGEEIGIACTVFCDASFWYLMVNLGQEAMTTSIT